MLGLPRISSLFFVGHENGHLAGKNSAVHGHSQVTSELSVWCVFVFLVHEMLRSLSSAITVQRAALKKAIETDRIESTMPPFSIKSLQQSLQEVSRVVFDRLTCGQLIF